MLVLRTGTINRKKHCSDKGLLLAFPRCDSVAKEMEAGNSHVNPQTSARGDLSLVSLAESQHDHSLNT